MGGNIAAGLPVASSRPAASILAAAFARAGQQRDMPD
jgi:hypothetical protein